MESFKIIRFFRKGGNKIIETGLTLTEAQAHCKREDTHEKDDNGEVVWFDGYSQE